MISIVICSRSGNIARCLEENILSTIGCECELIVVKGDSSIFKAYNKGISLSSYPLLCLIHEDVFFLSDGWGLVLRELLDNCNTGLVGLAGSTYKSEIPSPWWLINPSNYEFDFVQNEIPNSNLKLANGIYEKEVLVIDGVFIGCRKELLLKVPFDEVNYDGFHFYDLDISLHFFNLGYKNIATNRIQLYHSSSGNLNLSWIDSAIIFHEKWKDILPLNLSSNPITNKRHVELKLRKDWLILISKYKPDFKLVIYNYLKYIFKFPGFFDLFKTSKIIIYNVIYGSKD
jgi:hypothetical protein